MLDTHRVSLTSLDAMAEGRTDPAIAEQLKRANKSRQLTLLRAVLDRARAMAPSMAPLPPMDEAWTLLADAELRDGEAADRVLMHPQVGLWVAKVLRRLGKQNASDGDPPLWADLGYLHQLATAAAIRAGEDFRSRVPVWRGTVMLPTLGLADVQSRREWDFAQVHRNGGQVLIRGPAGSVQLPEDPASDGPGWLALRTLRTDGYELWLDDLDPYREFDGPMAPGRLPTNDVDRWSDALHKTWRLLTRHHPATAAELGTGLTTLVPRAATLTPFSAAHNDAFGSVVLSLPPDAAKFAETLVHEFQHSKFGVLLTLVDLLDPDGDNDTPRLYAPWRDDPRPPSGTLHGMHSFLGVTAFYRAHSLVETGTEARAAQFEFAYRREQTEQAVNTLLAEASLSTLGLRFLTTARARLRAWATEPLPDDIRAATHRANVDHRVTWRLRHLQPPPSMVTELAKEWLLQRPRPIIRTAPQLRPATGIAVDARLTLTRTWLIEPELYDDYRAEPALAMAEIAGITAADLALIDGDSDTAAERYQSQIIAAPESPTAWAGLALATGEDILLNQPELVLAVYREIRTHSDGETDPSQLARWLN